jgi:DNA-binding YbaB/EbfC family protein
MPEMPDFEEIMKMAQNAQNELQKAQDNLDKIEVEGAAGGGMVKIRATAKGRILAVDIDESLLAPPEKTMVEDLVAAAASALARASLIAAAAVEMQKMQGSLPLPPGFKLPF